MSEYIKNDRELLHLVYEGRLIFDSNNWWNLAIYKGEEAYDLDYNEVLDSYHINEAITEVLYKLDAWIEWIEKELF